jgi:hypothetical protein
MNQSQQIDIDDTSIKINAIHELCKQLNIFDYKEYCIINDFKNLNKKYSDFEYVNKLKFSINEDDIDQIDDIYELIQVVHTMKLNNLKKVAIIKGIKLYELEDINYFIKQYNIESYVIEI